MHLTYRNVNDAFRGLVNMINVEQNRNSTVERRPSRNGNVLVIDEPVTVTYTHPTERVLFNPARDANPFALLYEALWMLAGRNDVAPLAYYTKQFREYSDDGVTLNGAYGYRWRHARRVGTVKEKIEAGRYGPWGEPNLLEDLSNGYYEDDQIDRIIYHLKENPTSRRAVLQMWNVEDDLLKVDISRDVCCNLSVLFSLRPITIDTTTSANQVWVTKEPGVALDMTVTNRSNDLIWGMLGANYVTFSVLQEYVAARLGAAVGRYHHFTNNLHVYEWNWKPTEWLADTTSPDTNYYDNLVPLVRDPAAFEAELPEFVQHFSSDDLGTESPFRTWAEPFLETVAAPALTAYQSHKRKAATTLMWADRIAADDWRIACKSWLERRAKK